MKLGEKLTSRKFIVTVVTLAFVILGTIFDLDLDYVTTIVVPAVYVIVEGILDALGIKFQENIIDQDSATNQLNQSEESL